uniref:Uncharacterized protein n=1 Tax=Fagus sylvatica TaxID=28930 RepID=A0A2N9EJY0_FAGSY
MKCLLPWTWVSSHEMFASMDLGVDDAMHVSEEIDEVGITGEVTAISPPRGPTVEAGPSVSVGGLSSEVADFLKEFDAEKLMP